MKVYGVWETCDFEETRLRGLYATEELAEAARAKLAVEEPYYVDVERYVEEHDVATEPSPGPPLPDPEERERMRQEVRKPLPYEEGA
jgi:hypothetical protein